MLAKTTKLIFTSITIEIIGAFLVFNFFYTLFFNAHETTEILRWLWLPLVVGCATMYILAWLFAKALPPNYRYKIWQGVLLMFALLLVSIIVGMVVISMWPNNDINELADVFPVILISLAFGGLPTLLVGLWLGNRLKKISA